MSSGINELKQIPTAYATASAGMHPIHTLPVKLNAIAEAGFKMTEIAFPDLEAYATSKYQNYKKLDISGAGDLDRLVDAAKDIQGFCQKLGLSILAVMPFSQFEGYDDASKIEQGA